MSTARKPEPGTDPRTLWRPIAWLFDYVKGITPRDSADILVKRSTGGTTFELSKKHGGATAAAVDDAFPWFRVIKKTGLIITVKSGKRSFPLRGFSGQPATITFTGTQGQMQAVAVTNGGSGYTSAPSVSFSGGGGTGASATATISGDVVTSVTVNAGGSGYTSPPTVSFTGGGGSGAAGVASIGTEITLPNNATTTVYMWVDDVFQPGGFYAGIGSLPAQPPPYARKYFPLADVVTLNGVVTTITDRRDEWKWDDWALGFYE